MRVWYLLIAPFLVLAGVVASPTAAAECVSADDMTICSMDDEDGELDMPTLPSASGYNPSGGGQPGYSYGPGNNYNYYYDHGYRWFTP
ncbi:MAG: hypothetical protein AB7G47_21745 [Mycolicibacterium sp.]|uniref:hypothetical protein n=1 Tax=Mycolicibacterium sp. TaxID=2320850 RepID=UPI003D11C348